MKYDIIGDIHGHADELRELLNLLQYVEKDGHYSHPERKAIFTGDFIDGGQKNEEVLDIVMPMVQSGTALAVMGNHEYNAICYHTEHPPKSGTYLREHSPKNNDQHSFFLLEFKHKKKKLNDIISWFKTLPLFLDLNVIRVVHAEWNQQSIDSAKVFQRDGESLSDEFILQSTLKGSHANQIIETLLKGSEVTLPNGIGFKDKYGHVRYEGRLRWWEKAPRPDNLFMVPEETIKQLLNAEMSDVSYDSYGAEKPPVFFGHYWLTGKPSVESENAVCVDYSVSKKCGRLCCYRFDIQSEIYTENFVYVERIED